MWQGRGRSGHGEKWQRERKTEGEGSTQATAQGKHFSKATDEMGKRDGLITVSFSNQQRSKIGVLEVCGVSGVEPGRHSQAPMGRADNLEGEQLCNLRTPWDALGKRVLPSWGASGEGHGL